MRSKAKPRVRKEQCWFKSCVCQATENIIYCGTWRFVCNKHKGFNGMKRQKRVD